MMTTKYKCHEVNTTTTMYWTTVYYVDSEKGKSFPRRYLTNLQDPWACRSGSCMSDGWRGKGRWTTANPALNCAIAEIFYFIFIPS